ncbi:hypothetical protein CDAR_245791 [Caerostris darwini]|uniref:Uncharacterized protein n=1 Tax=Caerostris darwini TaxID=1538125 RepID=A0AAV4S5J1_9ARAC|nr:hypothetical protein CDAR_245791 [Caerostris darwini]
MTSPSPTSRQVSNGTRQSLNNPNHKDRPGCQCLQPRMYQPFPQHVSRTRHRRFLPLPPHNKPHLPRTETERGSVLLQAYICLSLICTPTRHFDYSTAITAKPPFCHLTAELQTARCCMDIEPTG